MAFDPYQRRVALAVAELLVWMGGGLLLTDLAVGCPFRTSAAASLFLLSASCTTSTEITLPALDASKTMMAEAFVVHASDYSQRFGAPRGVIRGAGEGANAATEEYFRGGVANPILWTLLLPIVLPVSTAVGAAMAHSEEEVDAAVAAFDKVGQGSKFLRSIDRRFIDALDEDTKKRWACIGAKSIAVQEICPQYKAIARLSLRFAFGFQASGRYDPDIAFHGEVAAVASVDHAGDDAETDVVLEAKWAYREKLGDFFVLAKDDAALLRRKLEDILDRFAGRIAKDLYLKPRPENIVSKEKAPALSFIDVPSGVIVRVEQGSDLPPPMARF